MKKFNYIYLIRNLINNKVYIGKHSTDDYDDGYFGSGVYLKRAIKKYGEENFKKTLLCLCDEEDLNEMEKLYIQVYGSTDPNIGYNLTFGGDGCVPSEETRRKMSDTRKGKTLSEETKQKMSDSKKGKTLSEETKQKMSDSKKGKTLSEETKQKMSDSKKGKTLSDETKAKMSESRQGENNPMYGKPHSDETKAKMSTSKKDKPLKKLKWRTPTGEIVEMDIAHVKRWHPDWILITEINNKTN